MRLFSTSVFSLLACALFLSGCKSGPDYKKPSIESPSQWRTTNAQSSAASAANVAWWEFYRDPVLTNLIATALENNKDLRIAAARVEQAQGGYRAQRSYLYPEIRASAGWTRARSGITRSTGNQFDIFGMLSYEVDVWGRVRRLTESARAQLLASEQGRRTVYITLVASVASTYFNLQGLDEQRRIALRTYDSRTNFLELTKVKFNDGNGVVSELDVRQAETQVFVAQSSLAQIE